MNLSLTFECSYTQYVIYSTVFSLVTCFLKYSIVANHNSCNIMCIFKAKHLSNQIRNNNVFNKSKNRTLPP